MSHFAKNLVEIITDTPMTQWTAVAGSEFTLERAGNLIRISYAVDAAVSLYLRPSSGTEIYLNNQGDVVADVVYTEDIALDHGRSFTFRTSSAASPNLIHLCIQEVSA